MGRMSISMDHVGILITSEFLNQEEKNDNLTGVLRQRNRAKMKQQSKTSEIELSNEEIASLSDGEFKALVIKILTELIELGQNMKEQMKDTQDEIKQNIQGTNSYRKKTRTQINNLEQKEEIYIQPEQNEKTRTQKSEESLTNLWDNLKCSNTPFIGGARRRRTTARN